MAPQHVEVMETLINLKRKIRRDKEGGFALLPPESPCDDRTDSSQHPTLSLLPVPRIVTINSREVQIMFMQEHCHILMARKDTSRYAETSIPNSRH